MIAACKLRQVHFGRRRHACQAVLTAIALLTMTVAARSAEDLALLEEQAMQAAVARVAPAVVRIETVGGLERAGEVLFGSGPTTGLIVGSDGWIISSAFNFAGKPSSILVSLPDGSRLPARLVATDHNRMLALLKVEPAVSLPIAEIAPPEELRVGAWAIAVGRTYPGSETNMSVGIVSALGRMHGRALQTDAKVSPANYGGPLVDIRGHVLGILVPLSPQGGDEMAGVEWYDSGIGFAIPMSAIVELLPRLQAGEDLRTGLLGVTLAEAGPLAGPVVLKSCRPNSPAMKAGLTAGDTIVEVDGAPVARTADLYRQIMPHYAGDHIKIVYEREGARRETDVELVAELTPYVHPYLGILAERDVVENPAGVSVRAVLPASPAAAAGLQMGDMIVKVGEETVATREELFAQVALYEPGQAVPMTFERSGQTLSVEATLAAQPEAIVAELPELAAPSGEAPADRPPMGRQSLKLPDVAGEATMYVPENYRPSRPLGVVMWFHGAAATPVDELLVTWQPYCKQHGLIFIAVKQATSGRWSVNDLEFAQAALTELAKTYRVDRLRTTTVGLEGGAAIAYALTMRHRELIGGVILIDGAANNKPPENEPAWRVAVLSIVPETSSNKAPIERGVELLRQGRYPVTELAQPGGAHAPGDEELGTILRWIDCLEQI